MRGSPPCLLPGATHHHNRRGASPMPGPLRLWMAGCCVCGSSSRCCWCHLVVRARACVSWSPFVSLAPGVHPCASRCGATCCPGAASVGGMVTGGSHLQAARPWAGNSSLRRSAQGHLPHCALCVFTRANRGGPAAGTGHPPGHVLRSTGLAGTGCVDVHTHHGYLLVLLLVGLSADSSATASSPFSAGPFPSIVRCVHVQLFLQQACLCAACAWACLLLQLPGWGGPHQPAPT